MAAMPGSGTRKLVSANEVSFIMTANESWLNGILPLVTLLKLPLINPAVRMVKSSDDNGTNPYLSHHQEVD